MSNAAKITMNCPNCNRPTSAEHLAQWHGVCEFCQRAFKSAHKNWVEGKQPREKLKHESIHLEAQDHAAFLAPGEISPTTDFDFDAVDRELGWTAAPAKERTSAAELLARVFCWIWSGHGTLATATIKFSALVAGLRPDLLSNRTYESIANELGVSKAAVSRQVLNFQDEFNIKFPRSYSDESREHCRIAALKHSPNRNGHK